PGSTRSRPCITRSPVVRPGRSRWGTLLLGPPCFEGGGNPQGCGWIIDRSGLRRQIVPAVWQDMLADLGTGRAKRVSDVLLTMTTIDSAALEKTYQAASAS